MDIDISKVKTYSLKKRFSKVKKGALARVCSKKSDFGDFFDSLPHVLKADDLRMVVKAIAGAYRKKKPVILMMGAHVIKCGLSPLVIDLIKRGVITAVALNGAGIIHDFELAYQAETSEDVACNLKDGSFGMGKETAEFLNKAINQGVEEGLGIGFSVGRAIAKAQLKYRNYSIIYNCYKEKVSVSVHVAIGTDIIHQHPSFDGASAGKGSERDFRELVKSITKIGGGGVVLNFGSSVIMPEVFLKALNLARNLGHKVSGFTTANFDMLHHYRPQMNVVSRPTEGCGQGYYIVGHHELMLPLLHRAIIEYI